MAHRVAKNCRCIEFDYNLLELQAPFNMMILREEQATYNFVTEDP